MKSIWKSVFACMVLVTVPTTASAQNLLGGLLGGGDKQQGDSILGVVGTSGSGSLVTVGSGGKDGLVSVNVNTGGSKPLVDASVLGPSGVADVNVNLGGVGASVNVLGPETLVDVSVTTSRDRPDRPGTPDTPRRPDMPRTPDSPRTPDTPWTPDTPRTPDTLNTPLTPRNPVTPTWGSGGGSGLNAVCSGVSSAQLVALFQSSSLNNWNRASNIQLVPMPVCAQVRNQVAQWLAANRNYHRLVGMVASDGLISAALSRTRYQPGHVLGVQQQGSTLLVYVF